MIGRIDQEVEASGSNFARVILPLAPEANKL